MKKVFVWIGIIVALLVITAGSLYMIYVRPLMKKMMQTSVIRYDDRLTLILGGGGNSGILTSDSLVIVIDSKMGDAAIKFHDTVQQIAGNRPILVVNTHWHTDHSEGNKLFAGQSILAGANYTREEWVGEAGEASLPSRWLKEQMDIKMGNDTVTILNFGKAIHTPSDVVVYLHRRKILFGGDLILNKQSPGILGRADPDEYLWVLAWLPRHFDIQKVVPGHGAVGGIEVIEKFKQYFIDMKVAAGDKTQEDRLVSKYDDWLQVPLFMSPGATIKSFRKKEHQ